MPAHIKADCLCSLQVKNQFELQFDTTGELMANLMAPVVFKRTEDPFVLTAESVTNIKLEAHQRP